MAAAATKKTIGGTPFEGVDNTQKVLRMYFTVALSGNYAAGGDTLDLQGVIDYLISEYTPLFVHMESQASGGCSGFIYAYVPGTDPSNGKIQVFVQDAVATNPLAELAAGAYPAGASGDTIVGYADFVRV